MRNDYKWGDLFYFLSSYKWLLYFSKELQMERNNLLRFTVGIWTWLILFNTEKLCKISLKWTLGVIAHLFKNILLWKKFKHNQEQKDIIIDFLTFITWLQILLLLTNHVSSTLSPNLFMCIHIQNCVCVYIYTPIIYRCICTCFI